MLCVCPTTNGQCLLCFNQLCTAINDSLELHFSGYPDLKIIAEPGGGVALTCIYCINGGVLSLRSLFCMCITHTGGECHKYQRSEE